MGKPLGRDHELERGAAGQDEIEGAVLVIGCEQPIECEQAC
jgi:hypothetical protein